MAETLWFSFSELAGKLWETANLGMRLWQKNCLGIRLLIRCVREISRSKVVENKPERPGVLVKKKEVLNRTEIARQLDENGRKNITSAASSRKRTEADHADEAHRYVN